MNPLPLFDDDAAQYPTSRATPALIAKTVIALIASDAGISVMLAKITVPYVYSVRLAMAVNVWSSQRRRWLRGDRRIMVKGSLAWMGRGATSGSSALIRTGATDGPGLLFADGSTADFLSQLLGKGVVAWLLVCNPISRRLNRTTRISNA